MRWSWTSRLQHPVVVVQTLGAVGNLNVQPLPLSVVQLVPEGHVNELLTPPPESISAHSAGLRGGALSW